MSLIPPFLRFILHLRNTLINGPVTSNARAFLYFVGLTSLQQQNEWRLSADFAAVLLGQAVSLSFLREFTLTLKYSFTVDAAADAVTLQMPGNFYAIKLRPLT